MDKISSFKTVQALRGMAALIVMFFHFRFLINNSIPGKGDVLFGWGGVGVSLFFIISGFVITLSTNKMERGLCSVKTFFTNRVRRIFPAYYILLLITFILAGAMSTFHYPDKAMNFFSALTFSPIYTDNAPAYIDSSGMYGIRWTLNYELYFYLIVGVCLLVKNNWRLLTVFFGLTLIVIPLLAGFKPTLSTVGYQFNNAYLNLVTNPIIWLFITGVAVGLLKDKLTMVNRKVGILMLILSISLTIKYVILSNDFEHGLSKAGFSMLLLVSSAVMCEKWLGSKVPRLFCWFGDISFSLYLIHTLLNTGVKKRIPWEFLKEGVPAFIFQCLLAILLAYLSYRFIERPFSKSRKNPQYVSLTDK